MLTNHNPLPPVTLAAFPRAAYLHIPFCRRRCYYCDFPVFVVGDHKKGDNSGTIQQYVEVLCQEITTTLSYCQPLETIFFGGGTPSLLSIAQLNRILETLEQQFGIAASAEISMEIDPGTFDLAQLQGYQAAGVNRFSLGVQAFQDELLQVCGRTHTVSDVYRAVDLIHQVGITNFSLDLISGLPRQTLEQWHTSLEAAVALAPTHLSSYDLIVESGTPFGRYYQPGQQPLPADEVAAQMYRLAQQVLTAAGYEHYEISNYAQPGYQCRHNRVYWEVLPYYGFGMGAASYLGGVRVTRPRKTQEYYEWVRSHPPESLQLLENPDILLETLMLRLRLAEGLEVAALCDQFGPQTWEQIESSLHPYWQQGWVQAFDMKGEAILFPQQPILSRVSRVRLSDPEGFLFSNTILAAVFSQFAAA